MSEIIVDIDEARRDLAAIFRWVARESMHEGIANHFSYAVSDDGQKFLMNPYGVHFSRMKASDLLLLDARRTRMIMVKMLTQQRGGYMVPCTATTRRHVVSSICIQNMPQH